MFQHFSCFHNIFPVLVKMVDSLYSGHMEGRAIYPASGYVPYLVILIAGKFVRSFGLFLSYDVLKVIHLIQFLCTVKGIASIILIPAHRPFTSGPLLTRDLWLKVMWHSLLETIINLLWLFGLTLCGPLRTILLFEHSEVVITAAVTIIFVGGSGGPSKLRGAVFILIAVISLLLFDNDDVVASVQSHGPSLEGHAGFHADHAKHSSIISHLFYHITSWFGLSDHKGGVCLLFITLGLKCWHENKGKKLALVIGGLNRLYAISTVISFIILIPWAFIVYMGIQIPKQSVISMLFPIVLIMVFVFLIDHYVELTVLTKVNQHVVARYGTLSIFIIALVLSCFWNEAYKAQVTIHDHIQEIMAEEHMLSGGVIFSIIMLLFATHILTSPSKGVRGSFIGYSPSGMPLYNITSHALQKTSQSVTSVLKNGLKQILEESDSRKIFYFLCINLVFTFVELVYGVWTNSLGLISDGFHMLFDCSALVLGLYAAIMTRWKATRIFSFGYDRVEVLSGFINGLFLTVIAVFVFTAAIGRLLDPPEISTERLLTVSVAGLIVNLIGITAFSHAHTHGGQACQSHGGAQTTSGSNHAHSHGNSAGHSHSTNVNASPGHSHTQSQEHGHNIRGSTNMRGVFLHILADTLGSVGVIVSTILIENFAWNISDPICSLFIAIMILLSVIPLLQESAYILLLRSPADMQKELDYGLEKVLALDGVSSYSEQHFWQHSSDKFCGTLHIQIREETAEQKIIQQVNTIFKELGVTQMTVQVDKKAFYEHMSGLGTDTQTKNYRTPISFRHRTDFVKSV